MTSGGAVSLNGSIYLDATYSGYGITGTLSLSASTSGRVSGAFDFEAKAGGVTVFSGSASASGRVTFEACVCS
jgi:hypothetical protein